MGNVNQQPIGVFDSGVGGLTVVKEIMNQLPDETIIYFGDTARVPYGNKSQETIVKYSRQIAQFLLKERVKAIVIACNTASAFALETLQKECPVPVLGVVKPGARAAAEVSENGRIGVIGTEGTVRSGLYGTYIREIRPVADAVVSPCRVDEAGILIRSEKPVADRDVERIGTDRRLAVLREIQVVPVVILRVENELFFTRAVKIDRQGGQLREGFEPVRLHLGIGVENGKEVDPSLVERA